MSINVKHIYTDAHVTDILYIAHRKRTVTKFSSDGWIFPQVDYVFEKPYSYFNVLQNTMVRGTTKNTVHIYNSIIFSSLGTLKYKVFHLFP